MNEALIAQIEAYLAENYWDIETYAREHGVQFSIDCRFDTRKKKEKTNTWIGRLMRRIDLFGNQIKDDSFADRLWKLIQEKGKTDVEVYKKAHLDRRLFSKIRTDKDYMPSKRTILALAIALELNVTETDDLLRCAGYAMSHAGKEDVVIRYFIEHQQYDMFLINDVLYHYGFKPLSD